MKTYTSTQPNRSINRLFKKLYKLPLVAVAASILTCFALSGQAQQLLGNPGFETGSLPPWTNNVIYWGVTYQLVHSGSFSTFEQGHYGNEGTPQSYIQYGYQKIPCLPGSKYTAGAYFSQYVRWYGVPGYTTEGGDNASAPGTNGASGLFNFNQTGIYYEDGWVEAQFVDATLTNILADYRSTIITPAIVNAQAADTNQISTNLVYLPISPLGRPAGTFTNTYLNWKYYATTNQYDPTTLGVNKDPDPADPNGNYAGTITNTLGPSDGMLAPTGAVYILFKLCVFQTSYASGCTHWDDCNLTQVSGPSASVIQATPDGTKFFNNGATNFTFTVTSAAFGGYLPLPTNPPSGIDVVVNGVDQSGSLQFSGSSTNWTCTLVNILVSNSVYNVSITCTNSANLISSATISFDTFPTNCLIVNSEDYDYNSGMFFENPIPTNGPSSNYYYGLAGVWGVDMSTYGAISNLPAYSAEIVRADGSVAMEMATDIQLPLYAAQSNALVRNVAIDYNALGNWENYTRVYPSNYCLVWARMSAAGTAEEFLNQLTSGYGTTNQTTNNIGEFYLPNGTGGGTHYQWVPLTYGHSGTPVALKLTSEGMGPTNTLQILAGGGGPNFEFFIFVPFSSTLGIPPFFNLNLPAQPQFMYGTNNITYTVYSLTTNILASHIYTYLNGQNVSSTTTCTPAGSAAYGVTNWTVSVPVPQQQSLTIYVGATDVAGLSNSISPVRFDTFSQGNFMFESEDWDFSGGQFIDNPVPTAPITGMELNSYYLYPGANPANASLFGIDMTTLASDTGETFVYRNVSNPTGTNAIGAGTEIATDFLRHKFIYTNGDLSLTTNSDYHLGWFDPGEWINYTRTFPTNHYLVYGRMACAGSYSGITLALVTAGWGTTNQTTNVLGTLSDATSGGWQDWHWVPLLGTNGQPVVVFLGNTNTIKVINNAVTSVNPNYYMFVPAPVVAPQLTATISGGQIHIQFPSQTGYSYTVLYSSSLTVPLSSWSTLTTTNGTGSVITVSDTISASPRYYAVKVQSQ